jgi:hypothetical protein
MASACTTARRMPWCPPSARSTSSGWGGQDDRCALGASVAAGGRAQGRVFIYGKDPPTQSALAHV